MIMGPQQANAMTATPTSTIPPDELAETLFQPQHHPLLRAILDNAAEGDWCHAVSDTLFHLGGDNRAWEFSAFDRGLDWLRRESRAADVYAATDARILSLSEGTLRKLIANDAEVAAGLLLNVSKMLCRRILNG